MFVIGVIGGQVLCMNEAKKFLELREEKKSPCEVKNKNICLDGM